MDKYTAQEMRSAASYVETYDVFEDHDREIAVMLRYAADLMEREEKREKKYEYAARYISRFDGETYENFGNRYDTEEEVLENAVWPCSVQTTIMRRAVGEWEEVNEKS